MIHLDTSFLVDLLREGRRREGGPATRFLRSAAERDLWISVHVACELAVGVELSQRPERERSALAELFGAIQIAYPGPGFPKIYGSLLAGLTRRGMRIATMDLLIATAALEAEAPIVSRNQRHFDRIPGLEVLAY